jgi:hypothetical protein
MVPDPETPVEAVAAYRNPWRRRLGDRIAKTCVVQKERVPELALRHLSFRSSEHHADGETPLPGGLPGAPIQFPPVIDADGANRGDVPEAQSGGLAQIEAVH